MSENENLKIRKEDMAEPKNGWTFNTLLVYLTSKIDDLDHHFCATLGSVEHRLIDKMDDADTRYEQRFHAQTEAVAAAAAAAKEGLAAALAAAKEAVAAALLAADRVGSKAELASDKQVTAVRDKLEGPGGVVRRMEELTSRLDTFLGTGSGRDTARSESRAQTDWSIGLFVAGGIGTIGIILALITLLTRPPTPSYPLYQHLPQQYEESIPRDSIPRDSIPMKNN
jgi:hypothetical protein